MARPSVFQRLSIYDHPSLNYKGIKEYRADEERGDLAEGQWTDDTQFTFALARTPHLIEAALLSTVNVGGDADTTGALCGALLGALHGWSAFPQAWQDGLEFAPRLTEEADALAMHLNDVVQA